MKLKYIIAFNINGLAVQHQTINVPIMGSVSTWGNKLGVVMTSLLSLGSRLSVYLAIYLIRPHETLGSLVDRQRINPYSSEKRCT